MVKKGNKNRIKTINNSEKMKSVIYLLREGRVGNFLLRVKRNIFYPFFPSSFLSYITYASKLVFPCYAPSLLPLYFSFSSSPALPHTLLHSESLLVNCNIVLSCSYANLCQKPKLPHFRNNRQLLYSRPNPPQSLIVAKSPES